MSSLFRSRTPLGLALGLALLALAGCSDVVPDPLVEEVHAARAAAKDVAKGSRVVIAPVRLGAGWKVADNSDDGPRGTLEPDTGEIARELQGALEGAFDEVTLADARATDDEALRAAFEKKVDYLLIPRLARYDTVFVKTNGWWWPNALFVYWAVWIPGWWIADEVYGVDVKLEYQLVSVRSERPVPGFEGRTVTVDSNDVVQTTAGRAPLVDLDDLDRGIDIFGTYRPGKLDKSQWDRITLLLEPYARRSLAAGLARDLSDEMRAGFGRQADEARARTLSAVHAVVVGVGSYAASDECRYADADAERFRSWLTGAGTDPVQPAGDVVAPESSGTPSGTPRLVAVAPAKNVIACVNADAQRAAVEKALETVARRATPEDTLVFYFAGRGVRLAPAGGLGSLGLVFYGASAKAVAGAIAQGQTPPEVWPLPALVAKLRAVPARRKLLVIDAGFAGGPRAVEVPGRSPGAADAKDLGAELAAALFEDDQRGCAILAAAPGQVAHVLEAEHGGLLTAGLVRSLVRDAAGALPSFEELQVKLERSVYWLAALETDEPQQPLVLATDPRAHAFER